MIKQERILDNRRLSVVVVTQQIGRVISGVGLYAQNLVEYLLNDGHQVCVIAPEDQRPSGVLPFTFVQTSLPLAGNTQARWISLSISFARELRRLQRHNSFDLVHFTDGREALFYRSNVPVIGNINDTYAATVKPLSFYYHNFNDWLLRWSYYRFVNIFEPLALRHLQAVIANSQYTARVIANEYHILEQQLHICHKSIIPERFSAALVQRDQVRPHPPRILFVGGNMQRKGLPILIDAAPRVLEDFPETEFWIVGKDKAESNMRSYCDQAGVNEHFRFFGFQSQDDLLKLYGQADIFVMPSLTEAFGVVFLEAMASGLPVIGTRVGGIPEIIEDGRNGILVEVGDAAELSKAIILVLGNRNLQENLRQAGLVTARHSDVDRMMQCTYQVYKQVLSNHDCTENTCF